jgi:5-methylcytosine-specific restriction endonuclease McrA
MKCCSECGRSNVEFYAKQSRCKQCDSAHAKIRYEANKEHVANRKKAWLEANKERAKATYKAWYEANRAHKIAYCKAWHEANKEHEKTTNKAWREANKQQAKAACKAWREANKVAVCAISLRRRSRLSAVVNTLTKEEAKLAIEVSMGLCAYCLKQYDKPTIEHVIPISKGGDNSADNIVIACQSCNSREGNRRIFVMLNAA